MEYAFNMGNKLMKLSLEEIALLGFNSNGNLYVERLIFFLDQDVPSNSKVEMVATIEGVTRLYKAFLGSLFDVEEPSEDFKSIVEVAVMLNNYVFFN